MHTDGGNWRNGFAAVFCIGYFKGEELKFPEIGLAFAIKPKDVILFKSWVLFRENATISKEFRSSIVLTNHHLIFVS